MRGSAAATIWTSRIAMNSPAHIAAYPSHETRTAREARASGAETAASAERREVAITRVAALPRVRRSRRDPQHAGEPGAGSGDAANRRDVPRSAGCKHEDR